MQQMVNWRMVEALLELSKRLQVAQAFNKNQPSILRKTVHFQLELLVSLQQGVRHQS